jgi:hypothetical protein
MLRRVDQYKDIDGSADCSAFTFTYKQRNYPISSEIVLLTICLARITNLTLLHHTRVGHPSTVKYCCCRSCKLQNHILPYISIGLLFKAREFCTIHRNK